VRRDEGLVAALSLPTLSLYNMRSVWAKLDNLADDITMRETDICFLTEVWQKQENKKHNYSIEKMLEMKGIFYISTPRPGARRGGGVAMAFPKTNFQVTKLNIEIPKPIECMFALVKPINQTGKSRKFIAVCFYSPPKSKQNSKLIDLISVEICRLRIQHKGCGVLICGDRNDMKVEQLLAGDPALRQIVSQPTNKNQDKVLDVVLTDMHTGYQEPTILPPIQVDAGREGVPSDHMGVEVRPRTNLTTTRARPRRKTFMVQPMPDSLVAEFGRRLLQEDWSCLEDGMSADQLVDTFQAAATRMVDENFPRKKVTVIQGELPFFTEALRKLRKQRDSVYRIQGKSTQYKNIQNNFKQKLKAEETKYRNKVIQEVKDGKRSSAYSAIRKLGDGPADWDKKKEFSIPAYVDEGLSPVDAASRLADHFSAISQTVEPLDEARFSPALRLALEEGRSDKYKPKLEQHDVYRAILKVKKPNSSVEGDVPKKLLVEYAYLWAGAATRIFNQVIQSAEWPSKWKVENCVVLHKTEDPGKVRSEEDTRTISKTNFLSKLLENVLGSWLMPIVEPYLDPSQCGGLSRTSTSHYLVKLLDFVHTTLDHRDPHAVVMAGLDLSKAYNRGDSLVIEDLHAMHCPGWLLAILCSYLSRRSMLLRYQGASSTPRDLPGGYGAGTFMGGFLFIIKFNGICLRPPVPRPITGNKAVQFKYIDDSSKAASVNLRKSLIPDPVTRPFPLQYEERMQTILDPNENLLQQELNRFHTECTQNKFLVNDKKSCVMTFNNSRKFAFPSEFFLGNTEVLQEKKTLKILGVMVQSDLKWGAHIDLMVKKASKKIWILRRMRQLGLDEATITRYWVSEGRVHLETGVPVWAGAVTCGQAKDLTRVQRRAVAAITGRATKGEEYLATCARLGLQDLAIRRTKLARTFARRTATKSRHTDTFTRLENPRPTRAGGKEWLEPLCRTRRRQMSAVPYLTRLLNGDKH